MDYYFQQLDHLLKTQYELETGIYKRMSNEKRLENYYKKFKLFQMSIKKTDLYLINKTCTTDCKVGNTQKSFNSNMKPITIKEMTLGTTYRNRYIIFEIITELTMMTSIMFLGKDENKDLVLIAIYNFENYYKTKDYTKLSYIFQKGKFILVLEPFYKMFGSGEDGIRIEDPNEIIIFDDKEWLIKFLEVGNKEESFTLFNNDNINYEIIYKEANKSLSIENYNTALAHFIKLKSLKPDEIKIDLKIAECYFSIPYYTKAIEKCNDIININETQYYLNALLIKTKSLLKLKKVYEANELLNKNKLLVEKNKNEFKEIEEEINNKIKNMKGIYDFYEIYQKSKESFNINIGEYVNQKLEIQFNKNKGISIYAKEKIEKGELLIVSKAIEISDPNKKEDKKKQYIKFDNPEKEIYEKTGQFLVYKEKEDLEEILSYKLSNFPEDYIEFFCLFNGKNKNVKLEERIKNKKFDLKGLQNIIKYKAKNLYFVEKLISHGLWYYPSLFNHSCIPNCYHFGFGDILIIIAINEIGPNSELFLNYISNDMLFYSRQKYLNDCYNFECECELCKYEKNKFKECNEKIMLNDYLQKLDKICYIDDKKEFNNENLISKKEIQQMIKFIENNKKIFNCYEKCMLYIKCAYFMRQYDAYISFEYLEKSLKYSENRNFYFEKLNLIMLYMVAKQLRSDARLQLSGNKFVSFCEKYFPNQKKFVDLLAGEYLK